VRALKADTSWKCGIRAELPELAPQTIYIVTGDNHLLKRGQFADAKIAKPAEFLKVKPKSSWTR